MKISYLTMILFLIGFIFNLVRIILIDKHYSKEIITGNIKSKNEVVSEFWILIPVLDEQELIIPSIQRFELLIKIMDINILYVATKKDRKSPKTFNIIEKYFKDKKVGNKMHVIEYAEDGIMSHQINSGYDYIKNNSKSDVIIGLYNVDSEITKETIEYVQNFYTFSKNKLHFLQQVCFFQENKKSGIINGAIRWQNRWSISHEYGRYLMSKIIDKNETMIGGLFENFQYAIGHGLFFTNLGFEHVGRFPEESLNEDNHYGYKIQIKNSKIYPIPYFEVGEFTSSLKTYIRQQSVWFNGPLYAFSYFKKEYPKIAISDINRALILSIKDFNLAVNWIFLPLLFLSSVLIDIVNREYIWIFCNFTCLFLYVSTINFFCKNLIRKYMFSNLSRYSIKDILFDCLFFILHSFGPCLTIGKIILKKNNMENKYRTEKGA